MKKVFVILLAFISLQTYGQGKIAYLENNRFDVNDSRFDFPQKDFNIIGFGAYHGSAKTEQAEIALLKSLTDSGTVKYYLPETDFSIAHYFNQYLKTGDTLLIKDLVIHYGVRVPQEQSVETYEKWKTFKLLNDSLSTEDKLTVVGIDLMVTYKYTAKHLLEILDGKHYERESVQKIVTMVQLDTTDFSPYYDSYSKDVLKQFVKDYSQNPTTFNNSISDIFAFEHILTNLKRTFDADDFSTKREEIIYENYVHLGISLGFDLKPQFLRFGFFHLEKQREGNNASFFTRLIENQIYPRDKVITVIGYLTESRVLWDLVYDEAGNYESFTTEGGFGIGDYDKEYFLGIDKLKQTKISESTLFRLNMKNTPYSDGIPELMEIVMENDKSNSEKVKGKSTTEFLDYAVLISNSAANTPIQEMN
jgi:hypothetical protein